MIAQRDWLWDRKISLKRAQAILRKPGDEHFISLAATLLSRKNTPGEVFKYYLAPRAFVENWRKLKRQMRKDNWNDPRIEYWQAIYENVKQRYKCKEKITPAKAADKECDLCADVAAEIKAVRKSKGLTQGVIAKKLNVSQQIISRIEGGRENISLKTLKKIVDVLGMRINLEITQ